MQRTLSDFTSMYEIQTCKTVWANKQDTRLLLWMKTLAERRDGGRGRGYGGKFLRVLNSFQVMFNCYVPVLCIGGVYRTQHTVYRVLLILMETLCMDEEKYGPTSAQS